MTGITLLPPNASKHERDLEAVISPPLSFPNRDVWNPDKCPEHLLPHLAWALSVSDWDSRWPAERKREVIKNSIFIHRKKGTRQAVESLLEAVRGDAVGLTEWFEDKARLEPGEFEINYLSTNQPMDLSELHALVPAVMAAKNVRSKLKNLIVTSRVETPEKHLSLSRQGVSLRSGPWSITSMVTSSNSAMLCISRQTVVVRSGPLPLES